MKAKVAQIYTGKKSGRTFEIREIATDKPARNLNVEQTVMKLKERRDNYAKAMVDLIMGILPVFNPANQVELSEQLAIRVIFCKIRHDRAKYLARGKTIPNWPGSLEYQNRAATALLLLLEPPYVLHDVFHGGKPAVRPKAAKARRKTKPRR